VHQYYEQELFTQSIENIRNHLIEIGASPKDIERWQMFIIKLLDKTKNDKKFDLPCLTILFYKLLLYISFSYISPLKRRYINSTK
jgi:hypothetical protein